MCVSVPEPLDVEFGEVRRNGQCLDTLGNGVGSTPGLYKCHGAGGNQVCISVCALILITLTLTHSHVWQAWAMTSTKALKHEDHCLGTQGSSVVLWTCISTSEDQHWEHNIMKQLVHKSVTTHTHTHMRKHTHTYANTNTLIPQGQWYVSGW